MFLVFWPEECTKKFRGRRKFGPKKLKIKLFTKAKLSLFICKIKTSKTPAIRGQFKNYQQ